MRIIVFGATGGVGRQVVRRAREAGHDVTAFVRSPEKVTDREGIRIVQGDAFDADAVAAAIAGQDAAVSCLSSSAPMKPSDEITTMVGNIVDGMRTSGVERIAYCASLGVDGELTGLIGRGIQWMLRHPLADHRAALDRIDSAGLDRTIARPSSLNDKEFAPYVEAFDGAPESNKPIPRASVADFLVKALEQPDAYRGASVGLAARGA
ncbi:NAD(P)-dependent oxidoreductase [uncultured Microbacterium sp.]|uniref:NAD(P)-dependent oxidoreductase n=1 Tax=uncultured Microbacterium sp. TaxID=191216 RepID=UPI002617E16C|nr:NAD(P)-binding oxidoreductase [uncultured Microbacterium sp.]